MDTSLPRPLLTSPQLCAWLGVSEWWIRDRLKNDPDFPYSDLAKPGAKKHNYRFDEVAVANHLGIPVPPRKATEATDPPAAA